MKTCYVSKNFNENHQQTIDRVNDIVTTYRQQGLVLTLRQVYYQFVSRGWIVNEDKQYKRLGNIINDARMAGEIDWDAIEDRTRYIRSHPHWNDPSEIVKACASQFRIDTWEDQKYRPEVWVEKDALIGVIEAACHPLDVAHFSCRGYTSATSMHDAAMRLIGYIEQGQIPKVFHLGDHDPSGCDMSRDIEDRLNLFLEHHGHYPIKIQRLALNMNQVEKYSPPPNPAKLTDVRATKYIDKYGDESWELDALEPQVLIDLITENIVRVCDEHLRNEKITDQDQHRQLLGKCSTHWNKVIKQLEKLKGGAK